MQDNRVVPSCEDKGPYEKDIHAPGVKVDSGKAEMSLITDSRYLRQDNGFYRLEVAE